MALSLNAPIEDLKLSSRVRNVLHLSGLHTVGSLLERDYKTALRRFGPGARAELASALKFHGVAPPAHLNPSEGDALSEEAAKLFAQMEASLRNWSARLEHFEARIRELRAKGRDLHQAQPAPQLSEQADASVELTRKFRARLTALRSASAALQKATRSSSSPEQRNSAALVEEESLRLSLLVSGLLEMLPQEKRSAARCAKDRSVRKPKPSQSGQTIFGAPASQASATN